MIGSGPALSHDPLSGPKTSLLDRYAEERRRRSSKERRKCPLNPIVQRPIRIDQMVMVMA
ncbi:hypothetical protein F2Q69_00024719 [Brassica cretica]|uniref:Uncharacterized protein n=1 Tax=Brassica cretica TaxID=69181 RepID=A0A8S9QGY5_BRACR|nr:hypothetical protein F2Q69_00024719 [Brassica cretica]